MTRRRLAAAAAVLSLLAASPPAAFAASPPASWDGLTRVQSKRLDAVYLLPGADFRAYNKVMLDPTEVAFQKNWLRDYNSQQVNMSARLSEADAQEALERVRQGFEQVFRKAFEDAGYQVVDAPAADVLRVRTAVVNLRVVAPDQLTAGRSVTFSRDAGGASVILEARDSESNALLGRAVDSRVAGDGAPYRRNSVTNRGDFSRLFSTWAQIAVKGLAELKARSPIGSVAEAK
jgi:hypothetical protein